MTEAGDPLKGSAAVMERIARGRFNLPLPRTVLSSRLLVATKPSACCSAKALILRSSANGSISQYCLACGRSTDRIQESDIPDLDCAGCPRRYSPIVPVLRDGNYYYECTACRRSWLIAAIVPGLAEVLDYPDGGGSLSD